MVAAPVDWATVHAAIHTSVVAATELPASSVLWADQGTPQPARPFATLRMLAGPRHIARPQCVLRRQTQVETIRIVSAAVQDYTITVYDVTEPYAPGVAYTYPAAGGDTATTIRDGLRALVAAGETDLLVADSGADSLTISSTGERLRFHTTVSPDPAITRTVASEPWAELAWEPVEATIRLTVETDTMLPPGDGLSYLNRYAAGLGLESIAQPLRDASIHWRQRDTPVNISGLAEFDPVSVWAQDFVFAVPSSVQEDAPWFRIVETPSVAP